MSDRNQDLGYSGPGYTNIEQKRKDKKEKQPTRKPSSDKAKGTTKMDSKKGK